MSLVQLQEVPLPPFILIRLLTSVSAGFFCAMMFRGVMTCRGGPCARPQPEWQINCQSVHIGCGRAQGPPLQSGCKITHTIRYGAEKCKILLPKFNTWRQGQIERKKGSLPPFENAVGRFFAKKCCRYGVIASRVCQNSLILKKLTKP